MKEIGEKFKETRLRKGLEISQVSKKTGIRPNVIKAIESGELPEMPIAYLRSFIKKYAELLKLEYEVYSDLLEELNNRQKKEELKYRSLSANKEEGLDPSDKNLFQQLKSGNFKDIFSDRRFISSLLYFTVGLALVIVIYLVFFSNGPETTEEKLSPAQATEQEIEEEDDDDGSLFDYFSKSDSLVLEATAVDSTWISVSMDGKTKEETLMPPGSKKVWKAKDFFNLTIGNAGGIQLKRNGEKLDPLGSRGSVVNNVKITEDKIEK